jgi:hypothetical protein
MKTKILSTLLLVIYLGCNKDDDSNEFTPILPAITQQGKNTFGCYINGVLLTPRDGTGTFNSSDPGMRMIAGGIPPEITYWEIKIRDFKSGNGGLFTLHIQDLHQNGEMDYNIMNSNCNDGVDTIQNVNLFCRMWHEASQSYKWYCSIDNGGILIINRYDYQNKTVSGTFNCTVQNRDNPEETIEITEGRFDIKWDAIPNFS